MKKIALLILVLPALACTLTNGATAQQAQRTAEALKAAQHAQGIEPQQAACTVTAIHALNLRQAPGIDAAVIVTLKHGDLLTILPTPPQGVWIPVRAGDLEGWINSNFCKRI